VIKRLNHVGIAVKDMEKTVAYFQQAFGAEVVARMAVEEQRFISVSMAIGEAHFEFLASTEPGSMIDKYIEDRGEGMHHVSLLVENFNEVIEDFKAKGMKVIGEAEMAEFKAAFIHPANNFGVLMELVEPK
jgi:methylmalonyl-CoA/ethylmalonyl-CoA epimerase